ncbi:hypothetical protein E2C01_043651 [Portunus trituberculatus]|uniref:Uncharacterized protein n=1 Tax=Portunus trituberculatus TaxID=210409 RepID=A0A5B7G053_PORTR|nr:hypothetical protein [Portunus trituberculatus]
MRAGHQSLQLSSKHPDALPKPHIATPATPRLHPYEDCTSRQTTLHNQRRNTSKFTEPRSQPRPCAGCGVGLRGGGGIVVWGGEGSRARLIPFQDLTMLNFCLAVRGMRGSRGAGGGGSGRSLSATGPGCSLASARASLHPMALSRSARVHQPSTPSHELQGSPRLHPRPRSPASAAEVAVAPPRRSASVHFSRSVSFSLPRKLALRSSKRPNPVFSHTSISLRTEECRGANTCGARAAVYGSGRESLR